MENVLTAFIIFTIFMFALMTFFQGYVSSQDLLHVSWQAMEERMGERARTDISLSAGQVQSSGTVIETMVYNQGNSTFGDFEDWDVIVQHYSASGNYMIDWLEYVEAEPAHGEWTVAGIYLDGAASQSEVFEPGVLNSGEYLLVRAKVAPPVGPNTTNMIAVSTSNGVMATTFVSR